MLIEGFRVRMFRSIRDSGFVPVFPLTALVGRERSGKTSLLRALRALDPSRAIPFTLERDWPRGSRQSLALDHVACAAIFRIDDIERDQLARQNAIRSEACGVRVGRTYRGALVVGEWDGNMDNGLLTEGEAFTSAAALTAFAQAHLPKFLFAQHDYLIPGAVAGDVLAVPGLGAEQNGVAALSELVLAAGLQHDELQRGPALARTREAGDHIRAALEDRGFVRGFSLTAERGRVVVLLEHGGRPTPADELPPEQRFRLTLELRVAAAAADAQRKTVLLLDGPGRLFRREAQARMRALFESYTCSGLTVIYTSRMPFQMELQHSEQVLVLAPLREGAMVDLCRNNPDPKFAVRAALGMTGRASFIVDDLNLVVEGTSDARILSTLSDLLHKSGELGLPDDASLTSAQGAEGVVGVSLFLGRQGLGVIALFDTDSAGLAGKEHLKHAARERPRIERLELLQVARAAGIELEDAAIEDLFPKDYYMEAARNACGADAERLIARVGEEAGGNPAARLSRAFEAVGRRYPKGEVIDVLMNKIASMSSVNELPEGMVGPTRELMKEIRRAAERLRGPLAPSEQESES